MKIKTGFCPLMLTQTRAALLAVPLSAALLLPAAAHHSFAMFDALKTVTLDGTVKDFQYTNPHIWVELMAPDLQTHQVVEWSIEGGTPTALRRVGWTHDSLHIGDKVTITIHPLRTGAHGGSLMSASGPNVHLKPH